MPNDDQNESPKKQSYYEPLTTPPSIDYPAPPMPNSLTGAPPPPPEGDIYAASPDRNLISGQYEGMRPVPTGQKLVPGQYGEMQPNRRSDPPRQNNFWKIVAMVMTVLAVICGAIADLAYNHIINAPNSVAASGPTIVATPGPQQTPTSGATVSSTPTNAATSTNVVVSPDNYSALQPGPGCDKNGGTWTPQKLGNITCGTQVTTAPGSSGSIRGYLFLQLPNNKAFSANNKIGVIGNPNGAQCFGLDEQDANTGFLAEYCGDGNWAIYTISAIDGSIVQTIDKNITSTRSNADISLTIKGTTLSFSIDNEVHSENNITPIQPTKVAITDFNPCSNCVNGVTINNFSYTVLPS